MAVARALAPSSSEAASTSMSVIENDRSGRISLAAAVDFRTGMAIKEMSDER